MGLDVTAYRKLVLAPAGTDRDDALEFYINPYFPGRADDLRDNVLYLESESLRFHAGSYTGYNNWREQLARLAGYPAIVVNNDFHHQYSRGAWQADGGPFWELIHFSDCEGVIGAAVAAKLAEDFREFQAKTDAHPDEYFREEYAQWRQAFEMASDEGAVEFR